MAPRFSRRKGRPAGRPDDAEEGSADLTASEHAWWAQRELDDYSSSIDRPVDSADPEESERDVLATHLGDTWRLDFGLDAPAEPSAAASTDAEQRDPESEPAATHAEPAATHAEPAEPEQALPAWERWDPFEPWTPSNADTVPPAPEDPVAEEPAAAGAPEAEPEAGAEPAGEPAAGSDPYAVLEISPSATWEEIVEAHRRLARHHHPDRFYGQAETAVAYAEERIRAINIAYQELRVRRGR